jgi:hypothetical protein
MIGAREILTFGLFLAACLVGFFHESLLGDQVLSPADVLLVQDSFRESSDASDYEPLNRLLMDPVLQFQPWLEFNRAMIRQGRLPLWNPHAGCGAPHLASGQSAVFDPFHLIAYLSDVPTALGWMAALRLWVAGMGSFLLARSWGLGRAGCWFAGLVFPFSGFLIVWLLYPVTPVAIWLPWLLLATDRVRNRPDRRSVASFATVVGLLILGGHIQTSAHVLLAGGLYFVWRLIDDRRPAGIQARRVWAWCAGILLGLALAAVQVVPLACYLAKSPVWADRQRETRPWWTLSPPRLLDSICTALPYVYGSQRRGQPNLARALGVHNLNESAGGYAGLATLLWLAPLGLGEVGRRREAGFLAMLVVVGAMGAFRLPPVDNLLRALPVLEVTDNRRLTLWVAFGLTALGAFGIDRLKEGQATPRSWIAVWMTGALSLAAAAAIIPRLEPMLRDRVERHYQLSANEESKVIVARNQVRASRQLGAALSFLPRYYGLAALELAALAGLAVVARRNPGTSRRVATSALAITMVELWATCYGLNPSISRDIQRLEPPVIGRLRSVLAPGQRAIGLGEELPPNVLMRFGLSDPRNYDSVELRRSLEWFAPLYKVDAGAVTSRGEVTWETVERARDRLYEAGVGAIVSRDQPPEGFPRREPVGGVWITRLDAPPWATTEGPVEVLTLHREPGRATIRVRAEAAGRIVVRETFDPGWRGSLDGNPIEIQSYRNTFIQLSVGRGTHTLELVYRPAEVAWGMGASATALTVVILGLTSFRGFWIPGITKTGLGRTQPPRLESIL